MTKSYTEEEFLEYAKNLKFVELEDAANYVKDYFEYYESIPEENKEEKTLAWRKYIILLSKYGHWFFTFSLMVISMRNELKTKEQNGQNS